MSNDLSGNSLWGPAASSAAGRVAGPTVTASTSLLAATTVDQSYREIQIDGYISGSTGNFFAQLLLGAGGAPSTTDADYSSLGTLTYGTATGVTQWTQPAAFVGFCYNSPSTLPCRFLIRIPGYADSGVQKVAFVECWGGVAGSTTQGAVVNTAVAFVPTGAITQVQISVRNGSNTFGTAQNCTGQYAITYLV